MSALPDRSPNPRPRSGERRVAYNPQSEVAARVDVLAMDLEAQMRASLRALGVDPPDDGAPKCAWCDKPMRDKQALTLDRERHKFCERQDRNGRRQYRCSGLDDYTLTHDAFQGHVWLKMDDERANGVYINKDSLSAVRDALSECIAAQRTFDDDGGDDDDYGECA